MPKKSSTKAKFLRATLPSQNYMMELEEELIQWLEEHKLTRYKSVLLEAGLEIQDLHQFSMEELQKYVAMPPLALLRMKSHFLQEGATLTLKGGKVALSTKMYEAMPSASSFADHSHKKSWRNAKSNSILNIYAHRPHTHNGTPVVILSEILSNLYMDLHSDKISPTREDCEAVLELMATVCDGFNNEPEMALWVRSWAARRFNWAFSCIDNSDGTWLVGGNMLMNLEVKLDKGEGGGDSYMRSCAYYTKHWINPARGSAIEKSVCPSILLEVVGPQISFYLFTSEGVMCDPFITESLLYNVRNYDQCVCVARICSAISKAAAQLTQYYSTGDMLADDYPYFRSFPVTKLLSPILATTTAPATSVQLRYQSKINNMVYVADMMGQDVVVKFTYRYNQSAHIECHAAGCAPVLYYCEKAGAYVVVIMEFIPDSVKWSLLTEPEVGKVIEYVTHAVSQLHRKNIVHGDLRRNNILVAKSGTNIRVAIVDFDWAGTHGVDRYPFFMNHKDIVWPQGASDGLPLDFSHDTYWIQRRFV